MTAPYLETELNRCVFCNHMTEEWVVVTVTFGDRYLHLACCVEDWAELRKADGGRVTGMEMWRWRGLIAEDWEEL